MSAAPTDVSRRSPLAAIWERGYVLLPLIVGLLVFAPRLADGGFALDDWRNVSSAQTTSLGHELNTWISAPWHSRSLLFSYTQLVTDILGDHPRTSLLWGVLSAGLLGGLIALLLRRLGVPRWAAAAIGTLGVAYPYATITKIWFTAHVGHVTGALAVGGILLALRGLRAHGRGKRVALHVGAVVLFLVSLMIYELWLPAVLFAGVAYCVAVARSERTAGRLMWPETRRVATYAPALKRWAVDAVFVVAWYLAMGATRADHDPNLHLVHRLAQITGDGIKTIVGGFLPFAAPGKSPVTGSTLYSGAWLSGKLAAVGFLGLIAFVVLCFAAYADGRGRSTDRVAGPGHRRIAGWGLGIIVAVVATFAGWLAIVPMIDYYRPVPVDSVALRVNVVAAFGASAVVVCVFGALIEMAKGAVGARIRIVGPVVAFVLFAGLALGWVRHDRSEIRLWNAASKESARELAGARAALGPKLAPGTTVIAIDTQGYIADGADIFYVTWAFQGAIRELYDDPSVDAVSHRDGMTIACRPEGIAPFGAQYWQTRPSTARIPYGKAVIVSVDQRKAWPISDRKSCLKIVPKTGLALFKSTPDVGPVGAPNS